MRAMPSFTSSTSPISSAWRSSSYRSISASSRSEEHTSELQSQSNLVCRLLLEKKKHDQPCVAITIIPERLSMSYEDIVRRTHVRWRVWASVTFRVSKNAWRPYRSCFHCKHAVR